MSKQWSDINLAQFQDIHRLSLDESLDEMTKRERLVSVLYNLSEKQVEELSLKEFNDLSRDCVFLQAEIIPGKPQKYINIGKKKYGIVYDVRKLKHRQYVEILHFSEKPIENMHLIMASLVQPIKWGFWKSNKTDDHEAIANDMLNAKLVDVYHSCVFFCNLYMGLIEVIKASLEAEMMEDGMNRKQAQETVHTSLQVMRGFTQHQKSQRWSA